MLVHKWSISASSIITALLAMTELATALKSISIPSTEKQLDLYGKIIVCYRQSALCSLDIDT